jgi:predicted MFS family arabinose efflux permease
MPKTENKIDVGIFLIIMGSGCVVGGYLSGYLSDAFHMITAGKLAIIFIFLISTMTALLNRYITKDLAFMCAVFWGITREFI